MFHILGFIFFFVLIILIVGLVLLSKIVRAVFGFGRKMTGNTTTTGSQQHTAYSEDTNQGNNASQFTRKSKERRKKVFDDDEGEYVDFEEIKNNEETGK